MFFRFLFSDQEQKMHAYFNTTYADNYIIVDKQLEKNNIHINSKLYLVFIIKL